jgi:adenylosuccinate synthase
VTRPHPQITVIVGAQWGDEGKGKVTDFFAEHSDYVVRFHGGNNAGHTVNVRNQVYKLHLIPSGVLYSHPVSVIGNGVVVNPKVLLDELSYLRERDIHPRLLVSDRAHVILPYHIAVDEGLTRHQGALAAGSTKRGIAPVYADKMFRHGIRMIDLLEPEILREKLEKSYTFNRLLVERVLNWRLTVTLEEIYDTYLEYGRRLQEYITDTALVLDEAYRAGKSILFEGAQGISLDVDHGIYPHTTSSNTVAGQIAAGTGVCFRDLERVIGVAKAYVSRVGISPFPTELPEDEARTLRERGREYGTTTGRPRRVGWLDLVQIRQAVRANGLTEIALTKLDILTGLTELPVCVAYDVNGTRLTDIPASLTQYRQARPVYEILPGWRDLDPGVLDRGWDALPGNLRRYVQYIEEFLDCPVTFLSIGPQRHETILK